MLSMFVCLLKAYKAPPTAQDHLRAFTSSNLTKMLSSKVPDDKKKKKRKKRKKRSESKLMRKGLFFFFLFFLNLSNMQGRSKPFFFSPSFLGGLFFSVVLFFSVERPFFGKGLLLGHSPLPAALLDGHQLGGGGGGDGVVCVDLLPVVGV